MKKITLVAVIAALAFASCKDESFVNPPAENLAGKGIDAVKAKLTGGDWKMTASIIKYSNGVIDDSPLEACKADDVYKYEASGDAAFTHGPVDCGPAIANGKYANWELTDNGAKLKETYTRDFWNEAAGSVVVYTVEFINNEKMVISRVIAEPGKTFTEINSYKR
jgi:hypothetical protein